MQPSFCRNLTSEKTYKNFIKLHLNDPGHTLSRRTLRTTDLAKVTLHHEKFLCEVARTGCSIIHVRILTKCIHEHFNKGCSHAFAQKLADALAFCRAKLKGKPSRRYHSKTILTGQITSKTASAVKAVISAINGSMLLMPSSAEGEAVKDANTPSMRRPLAPCDMVGDAAAALQRLKKAFGESQGSATACSSTSPHA